MALSLTNVQQIEFDELVKIEYHSRGFILRDTMRLRTDVIGNQVQFRKVGQIIAQPTGYQANLNLQDPNFTAWVATLQKYTAPTGVDEIQDLTVNFDTKRELAMIVAMSIGRRSDQIMINSFVGNASTTIAVNFGGGGNTNLTYQKLRQVVGQFESNAVPVGERFMACSGNNLAALLSDDLDRSWLRLCAQFAGQRVSPVLAVLCLSWLAVRDPPDHRACARLPADLQRL